MHKSLTTKDSQMIILDILTKPNFVWNFTVQSNSRSEIKNMHHRVQCLTPIMFRQLSFREHTSNSLKKCSIHPLC
ncbi:putative mitochondrial protein [Trifolium repens]|nr:putative mitochondrial protein [Trifolium repens]